MNVYIMRHGTTVWNEKGITQGRTNNRLSQNGKTLVNETAEKFKNVCFEAIICSPLMRTVQTANIMNKFHKVKIFKDDLLLEVEQGIFSGRYFKTLTDKEKELKMQRSKICGMESYEDVYKRAEQFLNSIKQKYPFKTVLIVTHNIVATYLENIILKLEKKYDDPNYNKKFSNAQVKYFEI